jgi:hypothetical protein
MVRTTLALCVAVLSGCATHTMRDGGDAKVDGVRTRPQACAVDIWLVDGEAVVGQDPVHTKNCPNKKLTWSAHDGMTFDGAGVAFAAGKHGTAPPSTKDCHVVAATTLSCNFGGWPQGQSYSYTLSLLDPGGNSVKVDPSIITD